MAHRMEIELTSARDEENFTWRAAGARQPRGVVSKALLPGESKVGDVFRVEVEIELDGISIVSVLPPKERTPEENRIEYIGPSRSDPPVTTVLAGRSRGRPERGGDRRTRSDRGERPRREDAPPRPARSRPARAGAAAEGRPSRPREQREGSREAKERPPARRAPQRFEPGRVHFEELLASLTPEQRPIAERLAIGGMPAVRKALAEEQQRARSEGRPAASGEPIIAIAEQLLGDVKAAVWLDRAEAAVERTEAISLRDLRTTVVGAAPRDEAGRELARRLREALDARVEKLRADWEAHLTHALDEGRVLQALRLSGKPPEPAARFPAALVQPLAEQAGQAMTADTPPDRWLALLEAAIQSPIRRQVRPAGLPKDPAGEVERQARAAASRVPAIARLLGMAIPPPPQPAPGERPARPMRRRPERPRPPARRAGTAGPPGDTAEPARSEPSGDETPPAAGVGKQPGESTEAAPPVEVAEPSPESSAVILHAAEGDEAVPDAPGAEASETPEVATTPLAPSSGSDDADAAAAEPREAVSEKADPHVPASAGDALPESADASGQDADDAPTQHELDEAPEDGELLSGDPVLGEEVGEAFDKGEAS